MVSDGDDAPDFTAPLADDQLGEFTLSERFEDAPIVLAFFPGAFTEVCSHEMEAFQDRLAELQDAGASVYDYRSSRFRHSGSPSVTGQASISLGSKPTSTTSNPASSKSHNPGACGPYEAVAMCVTGSSK